MISLPKDLSTGILTTAAISGSAVAAASLLSNPIGATGAALYGASCALSFRTFSWLTSKVVAKKTLADGLLTDICVAAATVFATWKAAEAFGISMTFTSALALSGATWGIGFVVIAGSALLTSCITSCARPAIDAAISKS